VVSTPTTKASRFGFTQLKYVLRNVARACSMIAVSLHTATSIDEVTPLIA
jgi:hypothetical protein